MRKSQTSRKTIYTSLWRDLDKSACTYSHHHTSGFCVHLSFALCLLRELRQQAFEQLSAVAALLWFSYLLIKSIFHSQAKSFIITRGKRGETARKTFDLRWTEHTSSCHATRLNHRVCCWWTFIIISSQTEGIFHFPEAWIFSKFCRKMLLPLELVAVCHHLLANISWGFLSWVRSWNSVDKDFYLPW